MRVGGTGDQRRERGARRKMGEEGKEACLEQSAYLDAAYWRHPLGIGLAVQGEGRSPWPKATLPGRNVGLCSPDSQA